MTPFGWPRRKAQQALLHDACRTRATARIQIVTAHDRALVSDVAAHLSHFAPHGLNIEPLIPLALTPASSALRVRVQFAHQRQTFGFVSVLQPADRPEEPQAVLHARLPNCVYQCGTPFPALSPDGLVSVTLSGFLRAAPRLHGRLHSVRPEGLAIHFERPPGLDLRAHEIYWAEFCWPNDPRSYGFAVRQSRPENEAALIEFAFPGTDDPTSRRRELRRLRRHAEIAARGEEQESVQFKKSEQERG